MLKAFLFAMPALSMVGCSAGGPDWQPLTTIEGSEIYIDGSSIQEVGDDGISAGIRMDHGDGSAQTATVTITCSRDTIDLDDMVLYGTSGEFLARIGRDGYPRDSRGRLIRTRTSANRTVDPNGLLGQELLRYCESSAKDG